jgi:hypothetical protein
MVCFLRLGFRYTTCTKPSWFIPTLIIHSVHHSSIYHILSTFQYLLFTSTINLIMKFTLTAFLALVAPVFTQSVTPAPTKTNDWFGPPWATSDVAKWSSIYNSLVSDGRIPSTLTAAPWSTDGWGPGGGQWGPGVGRGPGGPPGGHWGGMYPIFTSPYLTL